MKRLLRQYGILFTAMLLTTACGKETYVYPDLVTEMVCLKTDANGIGTTFTTDEGNIWHIQEGSRPNKLTADSTYRVVGRYAPLNETEAKAYSFYSTISSFPKPKSEYQTIHTDPVSIQSIWANETVQVITTAITKKATNLARLPFCSQFIFLPPCVTRITHVN